MHFTEQSVGRQQLLRLSDETVPMGVEHFNPGYLKEQNLLLEVMHGRGETWLFRLGDKTLVLRHYRRGGKAAALKDRYAWTGLQQTRAWLEFKLLAKLHAEGLPVPQPVAARVVRCGLFYRADLVTECLPDVQPLSQILAKQPLPDAKWQQIGQVIRRFHDHQVHHSDLNAHNILLSDSEVYLIDFDKSGIIKKSEPQNWKQDNLDRLLRSLQKLKRQDKQFCFDKKQWDTLVNGYRVTYKQTRKTVTYDH